MNFKKVFSAALIASSMAATGLASAQQFPDFSVNPLLYAPTANIFTADVINGNYNEVITFGVGTFAVSLRFQAGQFVANENTTPVGNTGLANAAGSLEYGLYALFQGVGTFNTVDGITSFTLSPGGSLNVFLDPGASGFGVGAPANTTFNAPTTGADPFTTNNSSDDILIATGLGINGDGRVSCSVGKNCGSFGQTTSFNLTNAGSQFLFDPAPFYTLSFQNGQFNGFPVVVGATSNLTGSLDVSFGTQAVPEPSAIALFGIALLGCVGISRRRKS